MRNLLMIRVMNHPFSRGRYTTNSNFIHTLVREFRNILQNYQQDLHQVRSLFNGSQSNDPQTYQLLQVKALELSGL